MAAPAGCPSENPLGASTRGRNGIFRLATCYSEPLSYAGDLVDPVRFELTTACLQNRNSPTELRTRENLKTKFAASAHVTTWVLGAVLPT